MWKGLSVITNTESPIVVVLSGSMEPAFKRGDLLFLTLSPTRPLRVGDITVYNVPGAAIPIVHRVIEVHDECVSSPFLLELRADKCVDRRITSLLLLLLPSCRRLQVYKNNGFVRSILL